MELFYRVFLSNVYLELDPICSTAFARYVRFPLEDSTLVSIGIAVSSAAFIAEIIIACFSVLNAAKSQRYFTMSIATVRVHTAAIDVGFQTTGELTLVIKFAQILGISSTAVRNVCARSALQAAL